MPQRIKGGKTFPKATEQFRHEYEIITEGERNADYVKGHWHRLKPPRRRRYHRREGGRARAAGEGVS